MTCILHPLVTTSASSCLRLDRATSTTAIAAICPRQPLKVASGIARVSRISRIGGIFEFTSAAAVNSNSPPIGAKAWMKSRLEIEGRFREMKGFYLRIGQIHAPRQTERADRPWRSVAPSTSASATANAYVDGEVCDGERGG